MTQDNRENRILAALALARGPLPKVERRWLHVYYEHLAARLSFPFTGQYTGEGSGLRPFPVSVVALVDPEGGVEVEGIACVTHDGSLERNLPLVHIEVATEHPNYQLLDDYWYWFWNWRFDPQI